MNDRATRQPAAPWDDDRLDAAFRALVAAPAPQGLAEETVDAIERERPRPMRLDRARRGAWGALGAFAACLALVVGAAGFVALRQGPSEGGGGAFPARASGLTVVTVADAARTGPRAKTDELLAVSGWLEAYPPHSCPAPLPSRTYSQLEFCGSMTYLLLDRPAPAVEVATSSDSTSISCCTFAGPYLWVRAPEIVDLSSIAGLAPDAGPAFPVVPVVVVGHFHDARAADCPADQRATCEQVFVADQLAWVNGRTLGPSVAIATNADGSPAAVHSSAREVEAAVRRDERVDAIVSMTAVASSSLHAIGAAAVWSRSPGVVWFVRFAGPPPDVPDRGVKGSSGWAIVDDASAEVGIVGGWNLVEAMAAYPLATAPATAPAGSPTAPSSAAASSAYPTPVAGESPIPQPTFAPCAAADLRATAAAQGGGTGTATIDVFLSTSRSSPCSIVGIPQFLRILSGAAPLAVAVTSPDAARRTWIPIVLGEPGGANAATFGLYWANWCGADPRPIQLEFGASGMAGTVKVAVDLPYVPRCDHPESGSAATVDAFATAVP